MTSAKPSTSTEEQADATGELRPTEQSDERPRIRREPQITTDGSIKPPPSYCLTCQRPLGKTPAECAGCGAPRPDEGWPDDPFVGRKIAKKYTIERRIGAGGFGLVFSAVQSERGIELGRVAVKLLRTDCSSVPGAARRFLDEARSARELESPHTVKVFDAGIDEDGTPFTVMELLTGPTLADVMADVGVFDLTRAARIADQVAAAMADSHGRGIYHRDLKPRNLVLGVDDFVKVIDFGIARRAFEQLGQTFSIVGSPAYMAPEQAAGDAVDGRTDIFSLGVVLAEMLTGQLPFEGRLPEGVPERVRALCASMIAPSPDDRPATMATVRRRLAGALERSGTSTTHETEAKPSSTTTTRRPARAAPPVATPVVTPSSRRRRAVIAAVTSVAAVALAVSAIAGWGLGRSGGDRAVVTTPPAAPQPVPVPEPVPAAPTAIARPAAPIPAPAPVPAPAPAPVTAAATAPVLVNDAAIADVPSKTARSLGASRGRDRRPRHPREPRPPGTGWEPVIPR